MNGAKNEEKLLYFNLLMKLVGFYYWHDDETFLTANELGGKSASQCFLACLDKSACFVL